MTFFLHTITLTNAFNNEHRRQSVAIDGLSGVLILVVCTVFTAVACSLSLGLGASRHSGLFLFFSNYKRQYLTIDFASNRLQHSQQQNNNGGL